MSLFVTVCAKSVIFANLMVFVTVGANRVVFANLMETCNQYQLKAWTYVATLNSTRHKIL